MYLLHGYTNLLLYLLKAASHGRQSETAIADAAVCVLDTFGKRMQGRRSRHVTRIFPYGLFARVMRGHQAGGMSDQEMAVNMNK